MRRIFSCSLPDYSLSDAVMSFFGFEQPDLEQEKLQYKHSGAVPDDVAVYTWGEEGYDGLGDLLQEGRDELNDETFGDTLPVGKFHPSVLLDTVCSSFHR